MARQATYWRALRAGLEPGPAVDDIRAVPVGGIAAVTGPLADDFVPLNTLAGGAAGAGALADDWRPGVAQHAAGRAGATCALGAEIGPIAVC